MADFRALCARMADELDHYRQLLMDDRRETHALATEARAALAQPEPVAPTDEEVAKIIFDETYYAFGFDSFPPAWGELEDCLIRQCCVNAARAVLARWGTPANNTREEN